MCEFEGIVVWVVTVVRFIEPHMSVQFQTIIRYGCFTAEYEKKTYVEIDKFIRQFLDNFFLLIRKDMFQFCEAVSCFRPSQLMPI